MTPLRRLRALRGELSAFIFCFLACRKNKFKKKKQPKHSCCTGWECTAAVCFVRFYPAVCLNLSDMTPACSSASISVYIKIRLKDENVPAAGGERRSQRWLSCYDRHHNLLYRRSKAFWQVQNEGKKWKTWVFDNVTNFCSCPLIVFSILLHSMRRECLSAFLFFPFVSLESHWNTFCDIGLYK